MKWEIDDDLLESDALIRPELVNDNCIQWDFALGSKYNLCAIFPRTKGESLADYKKEGARPVLYHKNLRMYHIIPPNNTYVSYNLYPARIHENTLWIGNQTYGNVLYLTDLKSTITFILAHERKRRWFFFWRKKCIEERVALDINKRINKVYYRISGNVHLFTVNVFENRMIIFLNEWETITFYSDQACTKKMEIKI